MQSYFSGTGGNAKLEAVGVLRQYSADHFEDFGDFERPATGLQSLYIYLRAQFAELVVGHHSYERLRCLESCKHWLEHGDQI